MNIPSTFRRFFRPSNFYRVVTQREKLRNRQMLTIPWWMGVAWLDFRGGDAVYFAIPLNLIIRWGREIGLRVKYYRPSKIIRLVENEAGLCAEIQRLYAQVKDLEEKNQFLVETMGHLGITPQMVRDLKEKVDERKAEQRRERTEQGT